MTRGDAAAPKRRAVMLAAAAAVAPAAGGCTRAPACDEAELAALVLAAERDADDPEGAAAVARGLAGACKAWPASLDLALRCHPLTGAPCDESPSPPGPSPAEVLCRDGDADPDGDRLDTVARQRRTACEPERFGAHEADEWFYSADMPAWAALAWLHEHGVDKALARRAARTMMLATATEARLRARCFADHDGETCSAWIAAQRVELAPSAGAGPWSHDAVGVMMRKDELAAEGRKLATVQGGRIVWPPEDNHRIAALDRLLEEIFVADREAAVMLYPDRTLSYGAVVDATFTAYRRDARHVGAVVAGPDGPHAIPLWGRHEWYPERAHEVFDAACRLDVRIVDERAVVHGCHLDDTIEAHDLATLAELARTQDAKNRRESVVHLHAPADMPWVDAVALLDAVRGPDCPTHADWGGEEPAGCWFHQAVLGLQPPIPWRAGDWSRLEVEVAEVETYGDTTEADAEHMRRKAEATLPRLTRCLREDRRLGTHKPSKLFVHIGNEAGRQRAFAGIDVPPCVYELWAPAADQPSRFLPGLAAVVYSIRMPGETD